MRRLKTLSTLCPAQCQDNQIPARYDQGPKRAAYFHAGVSHYWLVDPTYETFTVLERADRGYVIVLVAGPGEVVRAVPFDAVEIPVEELFLEEEGGPAAPEAPPL